jgi:hypothetical protein
LRGQYLRSALAAVWRKLKYFLLLPTSKSCLLLVEAPWEEVVKVILVTPVFNWWMVSLSMATFICRRHRLLITCVLQSSSHHGAFDWAWQLLDY